MPSNRRIRIACQGRVRCWRDIPSDGRECVCTQLWQRQRCTRQEPGSRWRS